MSHDGAWLAQTAQLLSTSSRADQPRSQQIYVPLPPVGRYMANWNFRCRLFYRGIRQDLSGATSVLFCTFPVVFRFGQVADIVVYMLGCYQQDLKALEQCEAYLRRYFHGDQGSASHVTRGMKNECYSRLESYRAVG